MCSAPYCMEQLAPSAHLSAQVSKPWKRPLPGAGLAGGSPAGAALPETRGEMLTWRERAATAPVFCRCRSAGLLLELPLSEGLRGGAAWDVACSNLLLSRNNTPACRSHAIRRCMATLLSSNVAACPYVLKEGHDTKPLASRPHWR